jgi:hypothetical protein
MLALLASAPATAQRRSAPAVPNMPELGSFGAAKPVALSTEQRDRLFPEFLSWSKTREAR